MSLLLEVRHRITPITNSAFDLFVDFYSHTVVPAMERHGIDLVGGWKVAGGEMGWDLSIQRYENMAHAEQALNSLANDRALWSSIDTLRGKIEIQEITKFAQTVSYGTEARLEAALQASPDQPRQYMLAVLQTTTGGLPAAIDQLSGLVDTIEPSGFLQLVTAYASRIGRSGELTDLWIMPQGLDLAYRAGDPLKDVIAPLREVAPEESIYYLNPLPYSKLQ